MVSPESTNWIYEYGLIDDTNTNFAINPHSGFTWPIQSTFNPSNSNPSVELDGSIMESDGHDNDTRSKKRGRPESCSGTSNKACREKLRRDKLNEKFVELASVLEPGRPPKIDKAAILVDAVRMVTQLRKEAQKLKDFSSDLHDKIKELKAEKNELRDEKQRLKMEKEKLEQQVNTMNAQPTFMAAPPAIPAAYARTQVMGNKLVPVMSYPGMAMWQFLPLPPLIPHRITSSTRQSPNSPIIASVCSTSSIYDSVLGFHLYNLWSKFGILLSMCYTFGILIKLI